MINRLNRAIKEEADFIAKKKDEVTVDFPIIRSEIRKEAFEEVKNFEEFKNLLKEETE